MKNPDNYKIEKVHSYEINGIKVETGDLICTVDGNSLSVSGQFWWLIGKLIPGKVDHIVIYTGPEGRCVEAGASGKVISFDVQNGNWDGQKMYKMRGFIDEIYGAAYPIAGKQFSLEEEKQVRLDVAGYCLLQAELQKPYNINFLDSETEDAFYCSQLAYKAYQRHNINLNSEKEIPHIPFTKSIVFPQEVWAACTNVKI